MEKLQNYISNLREKPEHIRRQALAGALTICMVVVGGVWMYSLGNHFGSGQVSVQAKEDAKPFALFTAKLKSTYQGLVASAGKASTATATVEPEEKSVTPDKVIDLIPVEQ